MTLSSASFDYVGFTSVGQTSQPMFSLRFDGPLHTHTTPYGSSAAGLGYETEIKYNPNTGQLAAFWVNDDNSQCSSSFPRAGRSVGQPNVQLAYVTDNGVLMLLGCIAAYSVCHGNTISVASGLRSQSVHAIVHERGTAVVC